MAKIYTKWVRGGSRTPSVQPSENTPWQYRTVYCCTSDNPCGTHRKDSETDTLRAQLAAKTYIGACEQHKQLAAEDVVGCWACRAELAESQLAAKEKA